MEKAKSTTSGQSSDFRSGEVCCSHKVFVFGFNTFMTAAEPPLPKGGILSIKPPTRIKSVSIIIFFFQCDFLFFKSIFSFFHSNFLISTCEFKAKTAMMISSIFFMEDGS
jgi:hypothetical protein